MITPENIQDWSILDDYLARSADNYRKTVMGNYDESTGYFDDFSEEENSLSEEDSNVYNSEENNKTDNYEQLLNSEEEQQLQNDQDMDNFMTSLWNPSILEDINGYTGVSMNIPIRDKIADIESSGDYSAFNPAGGGAGAVGKYQFRWNIWKKDIEKITGIKDKKDFLDNPEAQENFYIWYEQNHLLPSVNEVSKYNTQGLNDDQLARLIHFRGKQGAIDYLKGKVVDKPEDYNMSISDYIKQAGGIASTQMQQQIGLNDPSFDTLFFPLQGINTIRGLDSGEPVQIYHLNGIDTLYGPKDILNVNGPIYEKRIKKHK